MALSAGEVVADHGTPYHMCLESQIATRGNVVDIAWIAPAPFDGSGQRRSDVLFGSGRWTTAEVLFPEWGNVGLLHSAITPAGEIHAIWQHVVDGPEADFYHAVMR
jgi:hypothetical protein